MEYVWFQGTRKENGALITRCSDKKGSKEKDKEETNRRGDGPGKKHGGSMLLCVRGVIR